MKLSIKVSQQLQISFLLLAIFLSPSTPTQTNDKKETGNVRSKSSSPSDSNKKEDFEFEQYGVKYASPCEACKITVFELEAKLLETGKNGEILQTSYRMDEPKDSKRREYKKSQVRLIESMETACDGVLTYNVHKERQDSTRFAKGQSQTFQTLHGLVAKGVKVDLGMPYEMWDKPSAEITDLKGKCENLIETYESEIEDWYNQGELTPLKEYLCQNLVLKGKDDKCLSELPGVHDPTALNNDKTKNKGVKHTKVNPKAEL